MTLNLRKFEILDGAVTTDKLADEAVTLPKMATSSRTDATLGNSVEVGAQGMDETAVKLFRFTKTPNYNIDYFKMVAELKSSTNGITATCSIYIDDEVSPRTTLTTTLDSYEVKETGLIDISDLSTGSHTLYVKLSTDDADTWAYNRLIEFYSVQGE